MRHRKTGRKLNRNIHQRKALFKNLIAALILKGKISTTEAKAKAIKRLVDKLVNRAKKGTIQARRLIAAFIPDKKAVNKLVDEIAPRMQKRPSGFTTLERVSRRRGDNAVVVEVGFVDQVVEAEKKIPAAVKKTASKAKQAKSPVVNVNRPPVVTKPAIKPMGVKLQSAAQIQKRGEK